MQDKVCLVTGATAGIGLVTARELARKGAARHPGRAARLSGARVPRMKSEPRPEPNRSIGWWRTFRRKPTSAGSPIRFGAVHPVWTCWSTMPAAFFSSGKRASIRSR